MSFPNVAGLFPPHPRPTTFSKAEQTPQPRHLSGTDAEFPWGALAGGCGEMGVGGDITCGWGREMSLSFGLMKKRAVDVAKSGLSYGDAAAR